MKVRMNDWMRWDMAGFAFCVVYIVDAKNWELLRGVDTMEDAIAALANEKLDDDDDGNGFCAVIDYTGKVVMR